MADKASGDAFVTVRELLPGREGLGRRPVAELPTGEYERLLEEARRWPLDFIVVETARTGRVTLSAGTHGVAPVYLTINHSSLCGSWDMADCARSLPTVAFDVVEVTRLLALWFRYTHRTSFTGLYRLTERATAVFEGGSLSFRMPDAACHSTARTLCDDADVLAAYEELLDGVLGRHVFDPDATTAHVSGGMDSAVTGTHVSLRHPGRIVSSAMLLPGLGGVQQRRRRGELIQRADFRADVTTCADALGPLHPAGRRALGDFVNPYEEPYHEATTALVNALEAHGVRTVITGIGGDEMLALTPSEAPHLPVGPAHRTTPWLGRVAREVLHDAEADTAPPTVVNEMTLLALASAAPLLLKSGMWPVHPFADPATIRFGEWLPRAWRSNKALHRRRLAHLGFSDDVVHPRQPENFTHVMHKALREHIPAHADRILRDGSPLIDAELIDPDTFAAAVRRIRGGTILEMDDRLADVIAADLAVRNAHS
ncbi:asparagine synthase [Streptomyces sp. NPDC050617]|uniref:asparagine synthase n=1 Tax=Streptomyces sp. NPDC050617 TaxID=3154628 RepID=UPI003442A1C0